MIHQSKGDFGFFSGLFYNGKGFVVVEAKQRFLLVHPLKESVGFYVSNHRLELIIYGFNHVFRVQISIADQPASHRRPNSLILVNFAQLVGEYQSSQSWLFIFVSNSSHPLDESIKYLCTIVADQYVGVQSSEFSLEKSKHLFFILASNVVPIFRFCSKLFEKQSLRDSSVLTRF